MSCSSFNCFVLQGRVTEVHNVTFSVFFFTEILCCVSYLFPWLQLAYKSPVSRVITVKIIVASDRHGYQGS